MKGNLIILVITLSILAKIKSECPDNALLAPCTCKGNEQITCTGDKPFCDVFKSLAKKVDDKHKDYEMFILSDSGIQELPENCFDDIYFKEIRIERAVGLKKIHSNAFKGTDLLTQRIVIKNCPNLDTTNLWEIFNKFKKLDAVTLMDIGLKEIPSKGLEAHEFLVWLSIGGQTVQKLGEKAFLKHNSLTSIHITNTSLTEIPKDVFVFDQKSEIPLDVGLYNNPKLTKFDGQAFTQMGRPVTLDFSGDRFISGSIKNQLPVLEEKVFHPFLKANELNNIEMKGQQIDCTDCRNAWIKKEPKLSERVLNGVCADGIPIKGGNHFANCK